MLQLYSNLPSVTLAPLLSWSVLFYGTLEITLFSIIFLILPIKIIVQGPGLLKRSSAALFVLLFCYVRMLYIPLFISLMPIKVQVPDAILYFKSQSLYMIFTAYLIFGILPLLITSVQLLRNYLCTSVTPIINQVSIIVPVYNETLVDLIATVESIMTTVRASQDVRLVIVFDDMNISPVYLGLLQYFKYNVHQNLPAHLTLDVPNVYILRAVHGGKRHAQQVGWNFIKHLPSQDDSSSAILFIDSDMVIDPQAIHHFIQDMSRNPNKTAITGTIGIMPDTFYNFLHHYQLSEYIQGEIITRACESFMGGVTCLPGAFTMIRQDTFRAVADKYFNVISMTKVLDYHRLYLGEDRYLTHLIMEISQTGYCSLAFGRTRAVTKWSDFFKQRRRWLLGAISNEAFMMTSRALWKRIPFLLAWKTFEFCNRFMSVYAIVYCWQYLTTFGNSGTVTPLLILFTVPLVCQWLLVSGFTVYKGIYSCIFSFPILLVTMPFVQTAVYLYSSMTFFKRSWGGPRVINILA